MARRRRFLADEEDVVLDEVLHRGRLVRPFLGAAGVLAAAVAGFVLWHDAPVWFAWVLLGAVVGDAAFVWWRLIAFRATRLVVTNERIVLRAGVLRRYRREIPLASLCLVTVEQRFRQRLVGAGDVLFDTGSEAGPDRVLGVRHPERVRAAIDTARRAYERRRPDPAPAAPPGFVAPDPGTPPAFAAPDPVDARLARLERLHAAGVISGVEFAEKRAELEAGARPPG